MALDPAQLSDEVLEFLRERHLAMLSIPRHGSSPHVTPVGFMWDDDAGLARIITWTDAKKARLISAAGTLPVAVAQVDGGRWLTLEGVAASRYRSDR